MKHYQFVFCILAYKTSDDLILCLNSIKQHIQKYKIIIVNSACNQLSDSQIQHIAEKYLCDYFHIPNKGYGYGNNFGIEFIRNKYSYDYIIVANPDIIISKFEFGHNDIFLQEPVVIAPKILNGKKNQNPYWWKKNLMAERLIYMGYKKNWYLLAYTGILFNKVLRMIFLLLYKIFREKYSVVYAAHGSFFMISEKAMKLVNQLYDENMFMYAEESYLSHVFEKNNVIIYYTDDIEILHKGKGSRIPTTQVKMLARQSIIYYYEKIFKHGEKK